MTSSGCVHPVFHPEFREPHPQPLEFSDHPLPEGTYGRFWEPTKSGNRYCKATTGARILGIMVDLPVKGTSRVSAGRVLYSTNPPAYKVILHPKTEGATPDKSKTRRRWLIKAEAQASATLVLNVLAREFQTARFCEHGRYSHGLFSRSYLTTRLNSCAWLGSSSLLQSQFSGILIV